MKRRLNTFIMLGILAFGGYISYSGFNQSTIKAKIIPQYREVAVLKPVENSTISIDLSKNNVEVSGTPNTTINVTQPERTIIKWKTKIVEKLVVKHPTVNLVKNDKPIFIIPE